jgi:O-antigen ligase
MSAGNSALGIEIANRTLWEYAIGIAAVLVVALAVSVQAFPLIALGIGLAILAFTRFDAYLYANVFLLPLYPFLDWNLPVRDIFLICHFALFAGVCVLQQRGGASWKDWLWQGRMRKAILAFAAIAVLSLLLSESRDAEGAARALGKLLSYTAVFFSISAWAVTRDRVNRIIQLLLWSTVLVCLFGLYQAVIDDFTAFYFRLYPDMEPVFAAGGGWLGRITSLLFHYNSLAGYLNAIVPFALATTLLRKEPGIRRLAFICLTLSCAALYFTGSRGGMVALGTVFVFAVIYLVPRRKTFLTFFAALLVATCLILAISAGRPGQARLQGMDDLTLETRLALWGAAGALFLEHPVGGAGFGTYRFALQQYLPGVRDQLDAHNLYLQTLAEMGVIGLAVFGAMIWLFFYNAFKLIRSPDPYFRILGFAVCGAVGATLVHGLVDYIFIASPQFGNLFWLILALGLVAHEQGIGRAAMPSLATEEI